MLFVLCLISSQEKFTQKSSYIWTGIGGNGKSKLIELLRKCIGDYACTLPVALITQKRGRAEGATPALAATQGKRFACLQEPEGDETINVGLMKELTGGDTIIARKMYAEPVEFKPQFKMLLTCNILPDIKSSDRGTWRRVRAVEFTSVFTDNPDPNDPVSSRLMKTSTQSLITGKKRSYTSFLRNSHSSVSLVSMNLMKLRNSLTNIRMRVITLLSSLMSVSLSLIIVL